VRCEGGRPRRCGRPPYHFPALVPLCGKDLLQQGLEVAGSYGAAVGWGEHLEPRLPPPPAPVPRACSHSARADARAG
jgi:hypothetical protein